MKELSISNQTSLMRDLGVTPLALRNFPPTSGFHDSASTLEVYSEDDQHPVAAIRHDGCLWGTNWGFHPDMYTRISSVKVTDANDPNHDIDRLAIVVDQETKVIVGEDRVDFRDNIYAPNVNSSGSFTHCHVCEPEDQVVDYAQLIGRLIESTGQCAVRDDDGLLITDYKLVPGNSYAMASARLATTSCLGILNSVETVTDGIIEHPHGGLMLKHKVAEPDGHKILRVCGSGDAHVWVVKPVPSEISLTPALVSGLFSKYVNGILTEEKVVLTCHDDYSFQMILNIPSLSSRLLELEQAFAALTNA